MRECVKSLGGGIDGVIPGHLHAEVDEFHAEMDEFHAQMDELHAEMLKSQEYCTLCDSLG